MDSLEEFDEVVYEPDEAFVEATSSNSSRESMVEVSGAVGK